MNINLVVLLITCSFLCNCGHAPYYIKRYDQVVNREIRQLEKEENLHILGTGGSFIESIREASLDFIAYRRVNLNEARRLCVRCVEETNAALNADVKLHSYLNPFPFPKEKMNVGILFLNPNGSYVQYQAVNLGFGGISAVTQINGKLLYLSHDCIADRLEPFYEEPYETALAIVRGELPETDEDLIRQANKERYTSTNK